MLFKFCCHCYSEGLRACVKTLTYRQICMWRTRKPIIQLQPWSAHNHCQTSSNQECKSCVFSNAGVNMNSPICPIRLLLSICAYWETITMSAISQLLDDVHFHSTANDIKAKFEGAKWAIHRDVCLVRHHNIALNYNILWMNHKQMDLHWFFICRHLTEIDTAQHSVRALLDSH